MHCVAALSALVCAAAALLLQPVPAEAAQAPAPGRVDDGREAAQITFGILGFARWPGDPHDIRLCVIGRTAHAGALRPTGPATRHRVSVRRETADAPGDIRGCDALYLGRLPRRQWQALMRRIEGRPVLTIAERPEACVEGGMFCLDATAGRSGGFDVNLGSLAHSGVHVHPGALQLARHRIGSP